MGTVASYSHPLHRKLPIDNYMYIALLILPEDWALSDEVQPAQLIVFPQYSGTAPPAAALHQHRLNTLKERLHLADTLMGKYYNLMP